MRASTVIALPRERCGVYLWDGHVGKSVVSPRYIWTDLQTDLFETYLLTMNTVFVDDGRTEFAGAYPWTFCGAF